MPLTFSNSISGAVMLHPFLLALRRTANALFPSFLHARACSSHSPPPASPLHVRTIPFPHPSRTSPLLTWLSTHSDSLFCPSSLLVCQTTAACVYFFSPLCWSAFLVFIYLYVHEKKVKKAKLNKKRNIC